MNRFIGHLYTQLLITSYAIANPHKLEITRAHAKSSQFSFTSRFLVMDLNNIDYSASVFTSLVSGEYRLTQLSQQKQKLTAGNKPAHAQLASGPAGTHGHIFVQCQDLCFALFFLSLILLIDKGGVGLLYIYRMVFTYYTLRHLTLLFHPLRVLE
jgi:hypothetical protein